MEDRLLVFVSSLISEFRHEREVVEEAVSATPITRAWVFEHAPASSEALAESFLGKVEECDIFILLVGKEISEPVKQEYQTAVAHDKPRLVFLKDVQRTPEAEAFANEIDVKRVEFSNTDQLQQQVQEAVADELIRGYRHYRLEASEVGKLLDFMKQVSATTIVGRDQIQVTVADVNGQVAVGESVIQTGDISADGGALAVGDRPVATVIKRYLADIQRPFNAVLTAYLMTVLIGEMLFPFFPFLFATDWNPRETFLTIIICAVPLMLWAPCYNAPVAFFGLVLSILMRSRRNMALSILVGAAGIGWGVLARILIELGRRAYGVYGG